MHTRMLPTLAVFSAFSFVVMMFNLPLPGGTSGHALGIGVAAVVLGPWAGMLSISLALTIQAVFFADGGISTLGANCLNMGVLGVTAAWLLYRAFALHAAPDSPRRVFAAGAAGYVAINLAALATAIELGLQPLWFQADSGALLYAPYPLGIAVPAMLLGHLGPAGAAEALLSAGMLSWLQRAEPDLLRTVVAEEVAAAAPRPVWRPLRKLLALLGLLLVLTPLGQLAAGTAWGEWDVAAFADAEKRRDIAVASAGVELPAEVPPGLAQGAGLWHAPLPDYALPFLPQSVGYVFSAMLGSGLIILSGLTLDWLRQRRRPRRC